MQPLVVALSIALGVAPVQGGEIFPEVAAEARRLAAIVPVEHDAPARTVDVIHYALHVTFDVEQRSIAGRAEIELKPFGAPRRAIQLDADELAIASVALASGAPLAFTHQGTTLEIALGRDVPVEESLRIVVAWTAKPRRGLFFVDGADGKCSMVWSQGQCSMASAWFPCRDVPDDRASSELHVTLPDAWKSVSNGLLVGSKPVDPPAQRDDEPVLRTDHWRLDVPHPAYLVSVALGPFVEIDLGRVRELPLLAYATPELQAAAALTLQATGSMLVEFEQLAGVPYPWPAYRQACVAEFPWHGMENVAATTLAQDELVLPHRLADGLEDSHLLVAHELAHQWFGNLVTCSTWTDLWLNEGFATFCESFWLERQGEPGAAAAKWAELQEAAVEHRIADPRPVVSSLYVEADELFDETVYENAACFLHLLRDVVGEEKFFAGVKAWIARRQGTSAGTGEFEAIFAEATGAPLADVFQEWLHSRGQPEIDFAWSWDAGSKRLELDARQKQSGERVPEVFHVPVDVAWQVGANRRTMRMQLDARRSRVVVECEEKPKYVRFNAGGTLYGVLAVVQDAASWREQLALESDPLGRVEAARALAAAWPGFAAGDEESPRLTLAALARALIDDEVAVVRAAATTALGEIGGAPPEDVRREAARKALGCALWDEDRKVREAAAEAIGEFVDDEEAIGVLVRRFSTEATFQVRAALLRALARAGGARAVPSLAQLVDNERLPPELRGAALLAVVETKELPEETLAVATDRATKLAGSESPRELRLQAIDALAGLAFRSDAACDALLKHLDDPSPAIRGAVLGALGDLPDESRPLRALPALVSFHRTAALPDQRVLARARVKELVARLPQ